MNQSTSQPNSQTGILHLAVSNLWRAIRSLYYVPGQVITHLVRLAQLRADDWYRITAPWIINRPYPEPDPSATKPRAWYSFRHRFTFADEEARFNLGYAVRAGGVKGFALLYAMGAGDYFFTTPLLQALHERYSHLPIIAFATTNAGEVN